jgi:hypothetical protein
MKSINKHIYLVLLFLLFPFLKSEGNEYKVDIKFFIEDSVVVLNTNFNVYFLHGMDTITARIDKSSFFISDATIPDSGIIVCFDYKNIKLTFNDVKINRKQQDVIWEIKIDKKPFEKQEYWYLKKKLRKIKWLYTLNMGNGVVITEYRYTNPPAGI